MLWHRLLTAAVGIPVALLLVWAGGWWLAGAVTLLAVVGLAELYRLLAARGRYAYPWLGYPLAVVTLMALGHRFSPPPYWRFELPAAIVLVCGSVAWLILWSRRARGLELAETVAAHVYVAGLFSYMLRLRWVGGAPISLASGRASVPAGAAWVFVLLAVCWGMDTAAYAVGKLWGRHKLCPKISPGKTVEGAVAALAGAVALSVGLGLAFGLSATGGLALGVMLGIAGQAGDLAESMMKRRAGIKDSGAILPGHGGVLDRFDSLLFNAPVAFYYLHHVLRP